jgi:hypothetical protein
MAQPPVENGESPSSLFALSTWPYSTAPSWSIWPPLPMGLYTPPSIKTFASLPGAEVLMPPACMYSPPVGENHPFIGKHGSVALAAPTLTTSMLVLRRARGKSPKMKNRRQFLTTAGITVGGLSLASKRGIAWLSSQLRLSWML